MRLPRLTAAIALCACAATALPARAGDFMDARLSFNLTDENVFASPGQTSPSIPGLRFGSPIPRWGTLFFDNYDTRFNGYENLTNLVLYKKGQDGQSDFEGALVLRTNELSDNLSALYDGGSYIKWTYWFDQTRTGKANLSVTAFPMSSDPMRLGYSYKISWGGSPFFFKPNFDNPYATAGNATNTAPVPGAKVQFASENFYAYLGVKTSILLNKASNEQEAVHAILGGAGLDITDTFRLEANGGFFDRGGNPKQGVLGAPVQTFGVSGQAAYHVGVPVGRSVDFKLYQNDPTTAAHFFQPEEYPGGLTYLVAAEGTWTGTTLDDPDHPATTMIQPGVASDLNVRVKWNFLRVHADIMYRDIMYSLINVPGFVPFVGISPASAKTTPETFFAAGADYYLPGPQLTFGITGGLQNPSTFTGALPRALLGNVPSEALPLSSTVVVRGEGLFDILPPNKTVLPIVATKVNAKLQRGLFAIVGEVNFQVDNNIVQLQRTSIEDVYTRKFTDPYVLGFNLALQARF